MSAKTKQKAIEESNLDTGTRQRLNKNNNYIIEYIVSLSGVENQKVYIKHGFLGRGGFANCFITQLVGSNRLMATKVIDKNNLKSSRTKLRLINEIKIHKTFSHPNIVEFIHYFQDYDNVYIMLQLCENQSLNQLLKQRKTLTYPEVQSFLYGICNGVKYLHQKKFIHRDLKLGNIFLNEKFQIKIGDFGLTSQLQFLKENKRTVCGTPNYIAPQVLQGIGYYFQVDIWAIGIIIFTLFYGFPPFQSETTSQIYNKIRKCEYKIPKNSNVPVQAVNLIKSILIPKPENRPSIQQILNSPFMKLGNGIPLQLPQICYMRAPTKGQVEAMPCLSMKENILKQNKKKVNNFISVKQEQNIKKKQKQKSTMDRTASRECNVMLTGMDYEQRQKNLASSPQSNKRISPYPKNGSSLNSNTISKPLAPLSAQIKQKQSSTLEFVIDFEQIQENSFYFCTNKLVLGTYQKDRQICFRHIQQFQKNCAQIHQLKLFNNLFSQQGSLPFSNYKYKSLLNLKSKQIIKYVKKENYSYKKELPIQKTSGVKNSQKMMFVIRVTQHKDLMMLKLSNKCIQVIYDSSKHGFIYQIPTQKLYFYQLQSGLNIVCPLKQLQLASIMQTVRNFIKNSQKCSKTPNILTYAPIVDSPQYIKIPIVKLKHIYGIIGQLQNKKNKHTRNRNSQ